MKNLLFLALFIVSFADSEAQNPGYWQQHVDYLMDVKMDVKTYKYNGSQTLVYTNNSPDTLRKVFYHLYNNAFQPGSEMDARIQTIKDPDPRMITKTTVGGNEIKESRIKNLKPNEIGYLNVTNFKQDGAVATTKVSGTIMEVTLARPILPNSKTTLTLNFDAQVPIQIRRSGRNNTEGIELSMAQWYPKLAEYDFEGWHPNPYIAREFHGVWGNFDVKITIDKEYTIGGSGYLQNKNEIGHGYQDKGTAVKHPKKLKTLTWHFVAPMVHDFTWAADKEYNHDLVIGPNGVELHFLYQNDPKYNDNWKKLQPLTAQLMEIYNKTVGDYPYKQYSVIQGGDGGMEYAMCTLILGNGTFDGLLGVTAHEMAHSWFQHVLATNESKHGWMDEGFTSWLEDYGMNEIAAKKVANPHENAYRGYYMMANSGKELPQSTHADRFDENRVYSITSYSKGEVFLAQLEYLIGRDNLMKILRRFYSEYKFKHPTPNDIKRVAEKVSGANLDWYLTDWTQTTSTIDYGIKNVAQTANATSITLERIGRIAMPIDLHITFQDGRTEIYYIPLRMMHFEKPNTNPSLLRTVLADWAWAYQTYQFEIPANKGIVKSVTIDPSGLMADVKQTDNAYPQVKIP
ncbi:MAG TPA: M1 family metallopeptidase [Flavobacterium sp.]|jgi:hypothetical protein